MMMMFDLSLTQHHYDLSLSWMMAMCSQIDLHWLTATARWGLYVWLSSLCTAIPFRVGIVQTLICTKIIFTAQNISLSLLTTADLFRFSCIDFHFNFPFICYILKCERKSLFWLWFLLHNKDFQLSTSSEIFSHLTWLRCFNTINTICCASGKGHIESRFRFFLLGFCCSFPIQLTICVDGERKKEIWNH